MTDPPITLYLASRSFRAWRNATWNEGCLRGFCCIHASIFCHDLHKRWRLRRSVKSQAVTLSARLLALPVRLADLGRWARQEVFDERT